MTKKMTVLGDAIEFGFASQLLEIRSYATKLAFHRDFDIQDLAALVENLLRGQEIDPLRLRSPLRKLKTHTDHRVRCLVSIAFGVADLPGRADEPLHAKAMQWYAGVTEQWGRLNIELVAAAIGLLERANVDGCEAHWVQMGEYFATVRNQPAAEALGLIQTAMALKLICVHRHRDSSYVGYDSYFALRAASRQCREKLLEVVLRGAMKGEFDQRSAAEIVSWFPDCDQNPGVRMVFGDNPSITIHGLLNPFGNPDDLIDDCVDAFED
jgi:hypothetical protein